MQAAPNLPLLLLVVGALFGGQELLFHLLHWWKNWRLRRSIERRFKGAHLLPTHRTEDVDRLRERLRPRRERR